jgi:hypothetical protein
MNGKVSKNKKQTKSVVSKSQRRAQIFFAIFAVILILSMVFAAVKQF